jgi:predicted phage baseplate assembly protein
LKKAPLTYVPSARAGGAESSLELSVGGVLWDAVRGLFEQPSDARVYASRTQDDGTEEVAFGDGASGARVPSGRDNVTATYRVGAGVAGRVRARTLTSALDRPTGLDSVTNPLPAHGGADPERAEDARANAPATVRAFGRAVSLEDFADLLRETGQVAKAAAVWVWDGYDRAVHVTLAGPAAGVFAPDDLARLRAMLAAARVPDQRLRLANFVSLPVVLRATVAIDRHVVRSEALAATRAAVLHALAFDSVELGEAVHLSAIYRAIQDVPGVVSADIDELQPKRPADRDRPNVDRLADGTPAPLQPHVRVLPARVDPLRRGQVLPAELATVEDASRDVVLAATGGIDG